METRSNCSKHKKEVAGISDMKVLAEMIGNLHYETLAELLTNLEQKIKSDAQQDILNGRVQLGLCLINAGVEVWSASKYISGAWQISKPFIEETTPPKKTFKKYLR